jgi:hypothetical protein
MSLFAISVNVQTKCKAKSFKLKIKSECLLIFIEEARAKIIFNKIL